MAKVQKTQKERFIEAIVALLSAADISAQDLLLVKKPTLVGFLQKLPENALSELIGAQPDPQPPIDSTEWVDWFIATRQKLGVSREQILETTKLDKGDLSNFESKTKHFGVKRRRKLLAGLTDKPEAAR